MGTAHLLVMAILVAMSTIGQASSHYQTYETISRQVDDGNQVTSEKIYIKVNKDESSSKPRAMVNKTITNNIGGQRPGGEDRIWATSRTKPDKIKLHLPSKGWFHKQNLISGPDYDAGAMNSIDGHQFLMRPRTVESPAVSVDTGRGRSSDPSVRLANGIKRLFNVEEGHYTDIYDRIDKHKPLKKRKPAESIDERFG